ncbi:hypothetical protein [Tateyamaria sp.]|uniref:hypothetical protein n=1 Tax=Tateyamaria sp. TaxID=1929288 RepID=UPI003B21A644
MLRLIPSKAAIYAVLAALGAAFMAWLRIDARRDERRENERKVAQNRLDAIESKREIDRDVETQDDNALINRLTRR